MDARATRCGPREIDALLAGARRVVVAKGKQTVTFVPGSAACDAAALRAAVLGPSGNLRAPTLRAGKDWFVGFSDDGYRAWFGD